MIVDLMTHEEVYAELARDREAVTKVATSAVRPATAGIEVSAVPVSHLARIYVSEKEPISVLQPCVRQAHEDHPDWYCRHSPHQRRHDGIYHMAERPATYIANGADTPHVEAVCRTCQGGEARHRAHQALLLEQPARQGQRQSACGRPLSQMER